MRSAYDPLIQASRKSEAALLNAICRLSLRTGHTTVYKQVENLRIRNRFGDDIVKKRRTYYIEEEKKGYYPLDAKLRMDVCTRFSPLMTYL